MFRSQRGSAVLSMAGLAVLAAATAALVIALVGGALAPSADAGRRQAECNNLGLEQAIMVYPFAGTYDFSMNGADYEVTLSDVTSTSFDWQSTLGMDAVSVMSWWSATNVYKYDEAVNGAGLTATNNEQISKIYFCFDQEPVEETSETCDERKGTCPTPEGEEEVPDKCTNRKGCATPEEEEEVPDKCTDRKGCPTPESPS